MPSYTKTVWEDYPSTETPITASNLNKIENAIDYLFVNGTGGGGESLPVGSEIEFDGEASNIPVGWQQMEYPTVLYNNSTGSTSSITLNDSYTNYKYIEIWGKRSSRYGYTKLDTSVSNSISLIVAGPSTSNITFYNALCVFNDKTLSLSGNAIAISSSAIVGFGDSNEVAIVKVIGYK